MVKVNIIKMENFPPFVKQNSDVKIGLLRTVLDLCTYESDS